MKVIYNDGHVGEIEKEEELHVIRHSAAHIMAQAIQRLHPQAKFAYGPARSAAFTTMWTWVRRNSPTKISLPSRPR